MKPKLIDSAARFAFAAFSLGILAACGGGGSGGGGPNVADGGIRGTGSSVGPVSGFGSVIVNGVRFDTSGILNRTVESNDGISNEGELDEGMILRVEGEWLQSGEGTASAVEYDDTLRGPIRVIQPYNPASQTAVISILGLTVNIDRQTIIKGLANPADLKADDVVRVSGWRLANGEFRASLVRVQADGFNAGNEIEVEGRISGFTSSPCRFDLGSVSVDCSSLNDSALTSEDLDNNMIIEVEGRLNHAGDELIAAQIRTDDQRRYRRGAEDDIEISGPVTSAFSGGSFGLSGITVNVIDGETEFEDGLTEADLLAGLLVQVEGDYLENDTINAEEIGLREANSEVEGAIETAIDQNVFTVGGVRVQVTANTLIEDVDDTAGPNPTKEDLLNALLAGVEVEVEGIERENNGQIFLEAVIIQVEQELGDGDGEFRLEGKLRAIDDNSISVLGVTMRALNGLFVSISRETLAAQLPLLAVDYQKATGIDFQFDATEIELEDDD